LTVAKGKLQLFDLSILLQLCNSI